MCVVPRRELGRGYRNFGCGWSTRLVSRSRGYEYGMEIGSRGSGRNTALRLFPLVAITSETNCTDNCRLNSSCLLLPGSRIYIPRPCLSVASLGLQSVILFNAVVVLAWISLLGCWYALGAVIPALRPWPYYLLSDGAWALVLPKADCMNCACLWGSLRLL
jgi:hypothetical protein